MSDPCSVFSAGVVGPLGTHPVPGRPGPGQAAQASGPFKNPPSSQGYHAQVTWSASSQSGLSASSSGGEAVESRVLLTLCSELVSTLGWQRKLCTGLRDTLRDNTLQSRDIVTLQTADRDVNTAAVWPAERLYTHWLVFTKLQRKAALAVRVLTVQ